LHPFGVFSYLCVTLGISRAPVEFLATEQLALPSLIAVNVWKTFPFFMIMILGGLQAISPDLYEAAQVDGASRWQRFWRITIPLVRPVLVATTSLDLITTLGHYDLPKTLTEGGPMGATRTIAYLNWRTGFSDANFGYGAAMAVIVLIATAIATAAYLWLFARQEAMYGETTTGF
jgi:multiple sugar transport system permease protein